MTGSRTYRQQHDRRADVYSVSTQHDVVTTPASSAQATPEVGMTAPAAHGRRHNVPPRSERKPTSFSLQVSIVGCEASSPPKHRRRPAHQHRRRPARRRPRPVSVRSADRGTERRPLIGGHPCRRCQVMSATRGCPTPRDATPKISAASISANEFRTQLQSGGVLSSDALREDLTAKIRTALEQPQSAVAWRHRERGRLAIYAVQVARNRERSVSATVAASGMAAISSAHLRLEVE